MYPALVHAAIELNLSLTGADNQLGAVAAAPLQLLDQRCRLSTLLLRAVLPPEWKLGGG